MENILQEYIELFEATGGRIQLEKTFYFVQQWKQNNEKKEIKQLKIKMNINNTIIK